MINFYWWKVLGLGVDHRPEPCPKKSATMYQYWIFIWRQIFAFKCADLHFPMIVGFVQAHKLFARSIVGSHKCSIWGDIKQSTKLRLFLPRAAEKDRTMRRGRRRNNNVTQRFIECNKRNKYPRSFSCAGIKNFIYDCSARGPLIAKCIRAGARYEEPQLRVPLIAFGHFKNSFSGRLIF